jgi:hypothetical protein
MFGMMKSCGGFGGVAGLLSLLAFATTAAAVAMGIGGKKRHASLFAGLGLVLTGATGLVGFAGTLAGRSVTQAAVSAPSITKTDRARMLHQGHLEARECARLGLGFAALPFLLGVTAATMSLFDKKKEEAQEASTAASPLPPDADLPVVPVVLLGAAMAFTGLLSSGGLGTASVGGADYEPIVWSLMAKSEAVVAASASASSTPESRRPVCEALEVALSGAQPGEARACGARVDLDLAAVTELPAASDTCVRDQMIALGGTSPANGERGRLAKRVVCSATFAALPPLAKSALEPQLKSFE